MNNLKLMPLSQWSPDASDITYWVVSLFNNYTYIMGCKFIKWRSYVKFRKNDLELTIKISRRDKKSQGLNLRT